MKEYPCHLMRRACEMKCILAQLYLENTIFLASIFYRLKDRGLGEGNGNPLQYSCLENPMDGGAWQATVHGVAKSRTRLSDFTFTFTKKKYSLLFTSCRSFFRTSACLVTFYVVMQDLQPYFPILEIEFFYMQVSCLKPIHLVFANLIPLLLLEISFLCCLFV